MVQHDVKTVLFDYVKNPNTWFYRYHNVERIDPLHAPDPEDPTRIVFPFKASRDARGVEENLIGFFETQLDEVRIKKANNFARYALYISDNEDMAYFRDAVAKREVADNIDVDRQRDHAVHTLYNYLLGWYLFEHSEDVLQKAFKSYFEDSLKITLKASDDYVHNFFNDAGIPVDHWKREQVDLYTYFGDVWPIASLLHDVGYIFAGDLSSASPEVQNEQIVNGSRILHDFFNHWYWRTYNIDFSAARNIAKLLGIMVPDFKFSRTLSSLGDHLRNIGTCEQIRDEVDKGGKYNGRGSETEKLIKDQFGLNRDAFALWKEHYQFTRKDKMKRILSVVEEVFQDMIWVGSSKGKRQLDHGVASGLIVLQALTFFYEVYYGFKNCTWGDIKKKQDDQKENGNCDLIAEGMFEKTKKKVNKQIEVLKLRGELTATFWFDKVLWATAASAVHSIFQKTDYEIKQKELYRDVTRDKLAVDDDPLAYLGVMVDFLQEWDRYTVKKESSFAGTEPLQSTEVSLIEPKTRAEIIHFEYPRTFGREKFLKEVTDNLDNCLDCWTKIIIVPK